ncbi:hypothetical protein GCM10010174_74960 [Kutzneria viridogrisea]|uniref:Rhodanese-related sulfurtransferase n=1 Tax=Kutzneria viridogrisea TaxID=47990 RepID=A0ABR6BNT5_9PSEU|nr:rhodanese-related sulfurtransferase [Kutzneria viridogrisea]
MSSRHAVPVAVLVTGLLLTACGTSTPAAAPRTTSDPMVTDEVAHISRQDLRQRMADHSITVIDTLPADMHRGSHLPGSINIPGFPYNIAAKSTDDLAPKLVPDKSTPVALYCINPPCRNSEFVGREMVKLGYTKVTKYAEGIDDWVKAGLPLEGESAGH